ncbi:MAG: VanZ family protein, partial [Clostridia bacterium]|nr:VanZ family protein [Clostridia bacterium]
MKRSVKQRVLSVVTLIPLILISTVIFRFSAQSGEQSTKVSNGVTVRLLSLFMDVSELSDEELETLLTSLRHKIRKTAHILEYAAFGFFLELHLCTWLKKLP